MTRRGGLIALVALLLFAQVALAIHSVGHWHDADHPDEGLCAQCLSLAGAAAPPPATPSTFLPELPRSAIDRAPPATFRPRLALPFLSRAPPLAPD